MSNWALRTIALFSNVLFASPHFPLWLILPACLPSVTLCPAPFHPNFSKFPLFCCRALGYFEGFCTFALSRFHFDYSFSVWKRNNKNECPPMTFIVNEKHIHSMQFEIAQFCKEVYRIRNLLCKQLCMKTQIFWLVNKLSVDNLMLLSIYNWWDVVAHLILVAHQTSGTEVPDSNPVLDPQWSWCAAGALCNNVENIRVEWETYSEEEKTYLQLVVSYVLSNLR